MTPVLYDLQVASQLSGTSVVGWRTISPSVILAGTIVNIYRSYSPDNDYILIATVPVTQGIFLDKHGSLDKWAVPYYRLEIKTPDKTITYPTVFARDELNTVTRTMIKRIKLYIKNVGVPVLVYPEIHDGTRCTSCWDPILEQIQHKDCKTCAGTGYVGGFFSPYLTVADIRPPVKQQVVEDTEQNPSVTSLRMTNFPLLKPRDIIKEVNNDVLWRVVQITTQEKDRVVISQDPVELIQLKKDDIEYTLDIPENIQPIMTRRLVRKERLLIHNDGQDPSFIEVRV
jgi:hypothetical protein